MPNTLVAYLLIGGSLYYLITTMMAETPLNPNPVITPVGPANGNPYSRSNYDGTLQGKSKVPLGSQAAERSLFANGRQYFK